MTNGETPQDPMTNDEIPKDEVPNDELGNSGYAELGQRAGQYNQKIYDLEERTARFGEMIIDFAKLVPFGPLTNRLIDQLIGAGTSVGANYCEADDAVSKKDFRHR